MQILLPPSEGKTSPTKGKPLDGDTLLLPSLQEPRRQVLEALTTLCAGDPELARTTLGLTPGQSDELLRNQGLWTAPTAPAWQVYTGVLYGQLDAPSLTAAQRRWLSERVWIASALFGFVGLSEPIPAYRLSGDTSLPGIGALAGFWRTHLVPLLEATSGLVIDLRSGTYVKLAPLTPALAERTVTVRVLQKMPSGPPKLITHFNKATKGRIVRAIAVQRKTLRTPSELAQLVTALGAEVTVVGSERKGPQQLDIVVESL